ncbi:phospholipase D-like domain-containing protein [Kushneria phosphatilytica]|uniref:Phosphatidylserine/phosphatidylglycerophosphate/ cardiolipin synthase family protein n=1 Tax=Kushneria phosphatilytica TaxID=657387 RepID=A0A1S1NZ68_9GAMM|nr:phospholipase D-like domain-containing protein [Kushneria phosphatilytica]OHV13454.1 cardiolipin synthase B [Kushneria phosphatilytica]QEL10540.1 phosphatidylserine/phosphatidylglycerophosphate/cardiolipin synthase family protein [Kushneria phosphatilytica]
MREPWRDGNAVTLLPEAQRFLPALFDAIEAAEHLIDIELYAFEDGVLGERMMAALARAVQRGVRVRLLLDACGSWALSTASRRRMLDSGIMLRFFHPLSLRHFSRFLSRDHRKLVVVDERLAFTGGFGMTDQFLNAWFDVAVAVQGNCVADWQALFERVWNSRPAHPPHEVESRPTSQKTRTPPTASHDTHGMRGRVVWGQGYRYQAIRRSLHHHVNTAERRIWLCTPYFVPTRSLRRLLRRAARQGVDVRLLLAARDHDHPAVRYAGQRFYTHLLRAGVRIFEFQPAFIHAKFGLCDDWCTIGSCNFDHWSLQWNLEANQEIDDPAFAAELERLFERNFCQSREVTVYQWQQRSRWQRLREWCYGTLDALITRLR